MMKNNRALSAVAQRTLDGNAQSADLITATGISRIDQSTKPNECNAVISRAVLQIENCDALDASRLMTLLSEFQW